MGKKKNASKDGRFSPHDCVFCNANFVRYADLEAHLNSHIGETPVESDKKVVVTCPSTRGIAESVRREVLSLGKKWNCDKCGKSFATLQSCRNHNKWAHIHHNKKSKVYYCDVCVKPFPQKFKLNAHKKICKHTTEATGSACTTQVKELSIRFKSLPLRSILTTPPKKLSYKSLNFSCNTCNKEFVTKSNLKRHVYKFHQKPEQTDDDEDDWEDENDKPQEQQRIYESIIDPMNRFLEILRINRHPNLGAHRSGFFLHMGRYNPEAEHKNLNVHGNDSTIVCEKNYSSGGASATDKSNDLKKHSSVAEKFVTCLFCDKKFKRTSRKNLIRHIASIHRLNEDDELFTVRGRKEYRDYSCAFCGLKSTNKQVIQTHISNNHGQVVFGRNAAANTQQSGLASVTNTQQQQPSLPVRLNIPNNECSAVIRIHELAEEETPEEPEVIRIHEEVLSDDSDFEIVDCSAFNDWDDMRSSPPVIMSEHVERALEIRDSWTDEQELTEVDRCTKQIETCDEPSISTNTNNVEAVVARTTEVNKSIHGTVLHDDEETEHPSEREMFETVTETFDSRTIEHLLQPHSCSPSPAASALYFDSSRSESSCYETQLLELQKLVSSMNLEFPPGDNQIVTMPGGSLAPPPPFLEQGRCFENEIDLPSSRSESRFSKRPDEQMSAPKSIDGQLKTQLPVQSGPHTNEPEVPTPVTYSHENLSNELMTNSKDELSNQSSAESCEKNDIVDQSQTVNELLQTCSTKFIPLPPSDCEFIESVRELPTPDDMYTLPNTATPTFSSNLQTNSSNKTPEENLDSNMEETEVQEHSLDTFVCQTDQLAAHHSEPEPSQQKQTEIEFQHNNDSSTLRNIICETPTSRVHSTTFNGNPSLFPDNDLVRIPLTSSSRESPVLNNHNIPESDTSPSPEPIQHEFVDLVSSSDDDDDDDEIVDVEAIGSDDPGNCEDDTPSDEISQEHCHVTTTTPSQRESLEAKPNENETSADDRGHTTNDKNCQNKVITETLENINSLAPSPCKIAQRRKYATASAALLQRESSEHEGDENKAVVPAHDILYRYNDGRIETKGQVEEQDNPVDETQPGSIIQISFGVSSPSSIVESSGQKTGVHETLCKSTENLVVDINPETQEEPADDVQIPPKHVPLVTRDETAPDPILLATVTPPPKPNGNELHQSPSDFNTKVLEILEHKDIVEKPEISNVQMQTSEEEIPPTCSPVIPAPTLKLGTDLIALSSDSTDGRPSDKNSDAQSTSQPVPEITQVTWVVMRSPSPTQRESPELELVAIPITLPSTPNLLCSKCGKTCVNSYEKQIHDKMNTCAVYKSVETTHMFVKDFNHDCYFCGKSYKQRRNDLLIHIVNNHAFENADSLWSCGFCGFEGDSLKLVKAHVAATHLEIIATPILKGQNPSGNSGPRQESNSNELTVTEEQQESLRPSTSSSSCEIVQKPMASSVITDMYVQNLPVVRDPTTTTTTPCQSIESGPRASPATNELDPELPCHKSNAIQESTSNEQEDPPPLNPSSSPSRQIVQALESADTFNACNKPKKRRMRHPYNQIPWKPKFLSSTPVQKHKCPVCNEDFERVIPHIVSAHCKGSSTYTCSFCMYSNSENYAMTRHVRMSHTNLLQKSCSDEKPPKLRVSSDDPYVNHSEMPVLEPETRFSK